MERAFVVGHSDEHSSETELYPMGVALPNGQNTEAATAFLQHRFQGHCPHHLLHNLLNLHYGQHPQCTAPPFTNAGCRHGSHARPVLSVQEVMATAPARGAVIFLPFGLACRAMNDQSGIVNGCVDCEFLDDGDVCGSCRRLWHDGHAVPANASTGPSGSHASLASWRSAINLPGDALGEDFEAGEEDWDETWDETRNQEYQEEDYGDGEEEGLVYDYGDEGEEEWEGDEEEEGEEVWEEEDVHEAQQPAPWDVGHWAEDGLGGWAWSWFAQQPAAVCTTSAGMASAPTAAPPADASHVAAIAAAVQATLVACGAGQACATEAEPSSDADWRVRTLELELEMAKFKRQRTG
jgi:hypothetical protein